MRRFFVGSHLFDSRRAPRNGYSLLEILVSVGIVSLALGGMAITAGRSIFLVSDVRDDLVAANLAQEGVELVRNFRDNNWLDANTADGACDDVNSWRRNLCDSVPSRSYRVDARSSGLESDSDGRQLQLCRQVNGLMVYPSGNNTKCPPNTTTTGFRREIAISTVSASEANIRSTVRWCRGNVASCEGSEKTLTVEEHLRNWFPR